MLTGAQEIRCPAGGPAVLGRVCREAPLIRTWLSDRGTRDGSPQGGDVHLSLPSSSHNTHTGSRASGDSSRAGTPAPRGCWVLASGTAPCAALVATAMPDRAKFAPSSESGGAQMGCVCVRACARVCSRVCVRACARVCACARMCAHVCVYARARVCVRACVCARVCVGIGIILLGAAGLLSSGCLKK